MHTQSLLIMKRTPAGASKFRENLLGGSRVSVPLCATVVYPRCFWLVVYTISLPPCSTAYSKEREQSSRNHQPSLSLSRSLYGTDYSTLSLVEREYVVHSPNSKEREGLSLSLSGSTDYSPLYRRPLAGTIDARSSNFQPSPSFFWVGVNCTTLQKKKLVL
jgi:hypothetical protein